MTRERVPKMTEADIARLLRRAPAPPPAADDLASRIVARAVQARRAPKLMARRSLGRLWLALAAAALGGAVAAGAAAQAGYLDLRRVADLPGQILHAISRPLAQPRHVIVRPQRIMVRPSQHPNSATGVGPPAFAAPQGLASHPPRLALAHPPRPVGAPALRLSRPAGRRLLPSHPARTRRLREVDRATERPTPLANVAASPAPPRPMAEREPGPAERDLDRAADRRQADRASDRRDVDFAPRPRGGPFAGERRFGPDRDWRRPDRRRPFRPGGPRAHRRW